MRSVSREQNHQLCPTNYMYTIVNAITKYVFLGNSWFLPGLCSVYVNMSFMCATTTSRLFPWWAQTFHDFNCKMSLKMYLLLLSSCVSVLRDRTDGCNWRFALPGSSSGIRNKNMQRSQRGVSFYLPVAITKARPGCGSVPVATQH